MGLVRFHLQLSQRILRQQLMTHLNNFYVPYEFQHQNFIRQLYALREHVYDIELVYMLETRLRYSRLQDYHPGNLL